MANHQNANTYREEKETSSVVRERVKYMWGVILESKLRGFTNTHVTPLEQGLPQNLKP